jgi:hypothetical protein
MLSRNRVGESQAGYASPELSNEYPEEGKIAISRFSQFFRIIVSFLGRKK